MTGHRAAVLAVLVMLGSAARVHAGGLDLPALHTARHAGLAGASVAYVADPSAVLNNPAGLAFAEKITLLGGLDVFITNLQTNPDYSQQEISTGTQVAPVPFLAGSYALSERVGVGLGMYPVGAAGGEFHYVNSVDVQTINEMSAVLFEIAPALAVRVTDSLSLGAAYRVNALRFRRVLGAEAKPDKVDVDLVGASFTGFRLGAQWRIGERWKLGAMYRHKLSVPASAQSGSLFGQDLRNIETSLVMPSKLVLGARMDEGALGVVLELEHIWNSQMQELVIKGDLPSQGSVLRAPFLFRWNDSITAKIGGELRITPDWVLQLGYAYDGRAVNPRYPSAFSSPPTDSHFVTLGAGYAFDAYRVHVAAVQRISQPVDLAVRDIAPSSECLFCGKDGRYVAALTAIYFDMSATLDL